MNAVEIPSRHFGPKPLGRLFIAGAVRDLHQHLLAGRGLEGHIAARVAARNVARAGLHVAGADAPADIVAGRLAEGAERGEGLREFGDEISAVGAVPVFRYSANDAIADDLDRPAVARQIDDDVRPIALRKSEAHPADRKSVVLGKSMSVRVDL